MSIRKKLRFTPDGSWVRLEENFKPKSSMSSKQIHFAIAQFVSELAAPFVNFPKTKHLDNSHTGIVFSVGESIQVIVDGIPENGHTSEFRVYLQSKDELTDEEKKIYQKLWGSLMAWIEEFLQPVQRPVFSFVSGYYRSQSSVKYPLRGSNIAPHVLYAFKLSIRANGLSA